MFYFLKSQTSSGATWSEKVSVHAPADLKDLGLSPYYGWLVEILTEHIHPDTSAGETPEVPLYEKDSWRRFNRRSGLLDE